MELLRSKTEDLVDCGSTVAFMKRIDSLISAMMSRTPLQALSIDNKQYKVSSCSFQKCNVYNLKSVVIFMAGAS